MTSTVHIEQELRHKRSRPVEKAIHAALFLSAAVSVLVTVGIVYALFADAASLFGEINPIRFITEREWSPQSGSFGVSELIWGTMIITIAGMIFAGPLGVATAVYLSEYAPPKIRRILKSLLELLAGIPTVVFGYFALSFITPGLLRQISPGCGIFNWASASIVVGLFILPTIASVSDDAMRAVPRSLRDAAFGLGASKIRVSLRVVTPAALSGIVAALILGISRAVGETMAVTIAAGATPQVTLNPCDSVQTMTAYIVQVAGGEASTGSLEYSAIFAIGATLFLMTLLLNYAGIRFVRRYREAY